MKRFKNILYIVGDNFEDEKVVAEKVRFLAYLNEARVTVARIVEKSYVDELGSLVSERLEQLARHERERLDRELQSFVSEPTWQGIDARGCLLEGTGFIAVIRRVLEAGHDLVIKGGLLRHGVDQLAMRLLRKCPCPVWVIRTTHSGDFRKILAAVDVGADHAETGRLNRQIVELAHSLAQRERGEAHYAHAWRLEFESMMRSSRFKVEPEEIASLKQEIHDSRRQTLVQVLKDSAISASPENIHVVEGETEVVLEYLLKQLEIDVLVMGTVGRSGIPGLLIGNKAETILSSINCTVLAVKPDNFVSPVTL